MPGIGLLKSSGMFWRLQEGYWLLRAKIPFSCFARCWLPGPEFPWGCIFRKEVPLGHSWLGMPQGGAGKFVHSPSLRHSSTDGCDTASPAYLSTQERSCWGWQCTSSHVLPPASQTPKTLGTGAQIRAASEVIFAR